MYQQTQVAQLYVADGLFKIQYMYKAYSETDRLSTSAV